MTDTPTAVLFNIQRFSTEDGPGIRTTVFFKGCPLTCPWCHNPEGMKAAPRVVWRAVGCIACSECVAACPQHGLTRPDGRVTIDAARCRVCGTCVRACPAAALEMMGTGYTVDALLAEVVKDRAFYRTSGGGITLSGGEPLVQQPFLLKFLPRAREEDLHVALDTSGFAKEGALEAVLPLVDMVLLDLKLADAAAHKRLTGVALDVVLRSLDAIVAAKVRLWVRTPVIPTMTDADANIRGIAEILAGRAPTLERWDLLAFSNLCTGKYEMLDGVFPLSAEPLLPSERLDELAAIARAGGVDCVKWSGPTRVGA
jgi:pyruvate formate lyase activating enzyme